MVGELQIGASIVVGTVDQATEVANRVYEEALTAATNGDCDGAAAGFRNARRHVARNEQWWKNRLAAMNAARVGCLIRQAASVDDRIGRANILGRARRIDHHDPALLAVTVPLGEELERLGDEARAEEKWQEAYDRFRAAVTVDPTRVRARRKAEEARDHRLGLVPLSDEEKARARPAPTRKPAKGRGASEATPDAPADPAPEPAPEPEPERGPEG